MKRLLLCGVLVAAGAHAHPLDVAAYDAVKACVAVEPEISIDGCGIMRGRSPESTAARKAVLQYYKARTAFLGACTKSAAQCMHEVIWHTEVGIKNALDPDPIQASAPRSDERR